MCLLCRVGNTGLAGCGQLGQLAAGQKTWKWARLAESLSLRAGCTRLSWTNQGLLLTISYLYFKVAHDPQLFKYLTYHVDDTVDRQARLSNVLQQYIFVRNTGQILDVGRLVRARNIEAIPLGPL